MGKNLLTVKDLTVNVEEKEILHGVNLTIGKGETHVLLGPNGTGKSTLGNTLLGNPKYNVTRGEIWFQGKNITEEPVNERAKMGLFLSFQNPLEVPGVTLSSFIRSAVELKTGKRMRLFEFRKELEKAMEVLQMDPSYADRDLNVGFSGGEKKKAEILQLLMLEPSLTILDETDSGLDVDAGLLYLVCRTWHLRCISAGRSRWLPLYLPRGAGSTCRSENLDFRPRAGILFSVCGRKRNADLRFLPVG